MSKLNNSKRAIGDFFGSGYTAIGGIALMAMAGALAPNTPFFYDEGPAIEQGLNEAAVQTVQKDIQEINSLTHAYNALSTDYYANIYGDGGTRDAAKAEMDRLEQQITRHEYKIAANLYLNPNLKEDDFEDLTDSLNANDITASIILQGGEEHQLFQTDSEYYKSCQIETKVGYDNAFDRILETDRCIEKENVNDLNKHLGGGFGGGLSGLLLMVLLGSATYEWSRLPRQKKPSPPTPN